MALQDQEIVAHDVGSYTINEHAPWFDIAGGFVRRVLARLERGRLTVEMPDGRRIGRSAPAPGPDAMIVLHDWRCVRRVLKGGDVGFAEGYMAGEWTSPDLTALIELLAINTDALKGSWSGSKPVRLLARLWHITHSNTRKGSKRNISFHYDLGNEFYETWLDRGMQYSSAIYEPGDDLEAAQNRKLTRLVENLDIEGGERVLEIGCGWGAVAERLSAVHGCHVTGLTLSQRQLDYAQDRLDNLGLASDMRLQDYRDCEGTFDRIVSIEMIEAVGEKYWSHYFELLRQRLKEGGRAVIQAITIEDQRFETYRFETDFIQRYIFPGGMLPSRAAMEREINSAGLKLIGVETFGDSYAKTLVDWRTRFEASWGRIEGMGFDQRFRRMWDYYLCYCEAGFRAGTIDVGLYTIGR